MQSIGLDVMSCAKLMSSRNQERHINARRTEKPIIENIPTFSDLVAPTELDEDDILPLLPVSLTEREVSFDEKVKI